MKKLPFVRVIGCSGVDGTYWGGLLKKLDWECGLNWSGSGYCPVGDFCEHSNDTSGSIKGENFLTTLSTTTFPHRTLLFGVFMYPFYYFKTKKIELYEFVHMCVPITTFYSSIYLGVLLLLCENRLPRCRFPSGVPNNIVHVFLISPMRVTCSTHLILLDLISLIIFDEEYKFCRFPYANSPASYNLEEKAHILRTRPIVLHMFCGWMKCYWTLKQMVCIVIRDHLWGKCTVACAVNP